MMKDPVRTYQTRLSLDPIAQEALQTCAALFAHMEHCLLAEISKGKTAGELKSSYLVKYGITARQFNAIRVKIEGKIASIKELRKIRISDLKEQIKTLETKISKLQKKPLFLIARASEKTTAAQITAATGKAGQRSRTGQNFSLFRL